MMRGKIKRIDNLMKISKSKSGYLMMSVFLILLIVSGLSLVSFVVAQGPAFNVCCEKTVNGAWCQNTQEDQCDTSGGLRQTPTSCDATSFCRLGCCIDSAEGLCMENTPEKVCELSTGTWVNDERCQVPQCNLGCCVIGDQASFVTLTRCKRLSSLYALETDFRTDIFDEASCIATVYSRDIGACVFDEEGSRTCLMTSRGDCLQGRGDVATEAEFFKDKLCTADELATECGPTRETTCVEGRDEIYFKDSCGNSANIYDASKVYSSNPAYWQEIVPKSESCNTNAVNGNADSASCGNCNYLAGSICKKGRGASYGKNICTDLNCYDTESGRDYKNGESWCMYQGEVGGGRDAVGSRHFRHVCIQGEEIVEACADFRNEVCIQDTLSTTDGDFIESACRVNRWTDCIDQFEEDDCLNTDKRDCYWKEGFHYDGSSSRSSADPNVNPELANVDSDKENFGILAEGGICLPKNPPGLEFWQEGNAKSICSLGNSKQTVTFETGLFGGKECDENCDVLTGEWAGKMDGICKSLGDCGNYININGRFTDDGIAVIDNGKRRTISQGVVEDAKIIEDDDGFLGGLFD